MPGFDFLEPWVIDYMVWGFVANILSIVVVAITSAIITFNMSPNEIVQLNKFFMVRRMYIEQKNPSWKLWLGHATIFIPMYTLYTNVIMLFWVFRYPGIYGIVRGIIAVERASIIKYMSYDLIEKIQDPDDK